MSAFTYEIVGYTARFSDGMELAKRSTRQFSHAWRVRYLVHGQLQCVSGFSSSYLLAETAVRSHAKAIRPSRQSSPSCFYDSDIVETQVGR